ncbi:cell division protein FtsK [Kribbella voronezhensis]|uniref:cell division protein FtsK n=1 Tax=Kribbella voronezhensis TaxID=2512212 RepID=UPI00106385F8|nr:cell division protein FtsK [Kribbella voronezhensis]
MQTEPPRLSRRAVLRSAAVVAGSATLLTGCEDEKDHSGTPGATEGPDGPTPPPPSTDPVVVAALTTAATQVAQLSLRYSQVLQGYPKLRAQLAAGVKNHAAQFAKLKEVGGFEPPQPGKLPALPGTAAAALAELAGREQKLSVSHATAAVKVSGEAARLLAMLAAAESQLAATLTVGKKKAAS